MSDSSNAGYIKREEGETLDETLTELLRTWKHTTTTAQPTFLGLCVTKGCNFMQAKNKST